MKRAVAILLLIAIVFVSGCTNQTPSTSSSSGRVVCNAPYMRFETGCCLDKNSNDICDKHENGDVNFNNTKSETVGAEEVSNEPVELLFLINGEKLLEVDDFPLPYTKPSACSVVRRAFSDDTSCKSIEEIEDGVFKIEETCTAQDEDNDICNEGELRSRITIDVNELEINKLSFE